MFRFFWVRIQTTSNFLASFAFSPFFTKEEFTATWLQHFSILNSFRNQTVSINNQSQRSESRQRFDNESPQMPLLFKQFSKAIFFGFVATFSQVINGEWIEGYSGSITYISNDSLRKTKQIASQIEIFQDALTSHIIKEPKRSKWPLRIIICKDGTTFHELVPEGNKYQLNVAGLYTSGLAYDLIVIRSDANQYQMRKVVYHEMTHRIMRTGVQLPLWLDEGLAETYSGFASKSKEIRFGLRDTSHCRWINRKGLTSLTRLFHVTHDSPEYNRPELTPFFYATSWAFVHFCLYNENPNVRKAFDEFREKALLGIPSKRDFEEAFGCSYSEMQETLTKYARQFRHPYERIKEDRKDKDFQVEFSPITKATIRSYKAGALTLAHRYNDANRLLNEKPSTQKLEKASKLATIEQIQLDYYLGNHDQAQKESENSYLNDNRNPIVLLSYAERLLNTRPGQKVWLGEVLPNKTINEAMTCINQLLEMNHDKIQAWNLYALGWLRTETQPEYRHIQRLLNSCQLLPTEKNLHLLTSEILRRSNRKTEAIKLLRRFLQSTSRPADRKDVQEKLRELGVDGSS